MEDTLASIRPSINQSCELEQSFVNGRDPSILAFGQFKIPAENSKRNLVSLFEDEELESSGKCSSIASLQSLPQTIKVYLRMRPFPPKMKLTEEQQRAYILLNSTTLLTKIPVIDSNASALRKPKGNETVSRKFTFTSTFGPETTQLQLFESAIKQQMVDFLSGQSGTVMSYGTTNAGKSYTLQGNTSSPGIIPRALEFVFSNLSPRSTPCYKPLYNTEVVSLNANDRAYEMELKTKLLSFGSVDKNQYIQAYRSMQQLLQDESPLRTSDTSNASYSVWVSFAEIYNESIYDLLSNDCQEKKISLKLATDRSGKAYIKGLKMVCVNSGSEAYQLLMVGQYNLKVAATALNARSSRSHCIFTIKLLKYHKENSPTNVEVSTFSFCDLAGSERLKKTLNAGDRLKEAQNINTSLLVLGRCLKSIFQGQSMNLKQGLVGPFRESKLTRLFQCALSGKEHIALIVNVNPVPNLYVETQNVLNFSAIAKHIIVEPVTRVKRKASTSRFSLMVSQSIKTVTDWDVTDLESIASQESSVDVDQAEYIYAEDYDELVRENEELKKEIVKLKSSALTSDFKIRQELSKVYTTMMNDLETNFKNRLQDVEEQQEDMLEWSVQQVENYYKEKLNNLVKKKRSCNDSDDELDSELNLEELEAENVQLVAKVESLKKSLKEVRESNEKLIIENNHNASKLSLVQKDLTNYKNLLIAAQNDIGCGEGPAQIVEELNKQLSTRDDQIKLLKKYLNEAKAEWLQATAVESKLEESLKKKDQELIEASETISDLSDQIEHTNLCLAESTKTVENLEDKLEVCAKQLAFAEEKAQTYEDKWSKAAANNLVLLNENAELKKLLDERLAAAKDVQLDVPAVESTETQNLVTVKTEILDSEHDFVLNNDKTEDDALSGTIASNEVGPSSNTNEKSDDEIVREKPTQLKTKHNDLKAQYLSETLQEKKLNEKLSDAEQRLHLLHASLEASERENIECKKSLSLVENELQSFMEKVIDATKQLEELKQANTALSEKVTLDENKIEELQNYCREKDTKDKEYSQALQERAVKINLLENELSETVKKLQNISAECSLGHKNHIKKLEQDLSIAEERYDIQVQLLEAHILRIQKLEDNLSEMEDLKKKVAALGDQLKICEAEKADLLVQLDEYGSKLMTLESELQASISREKDKENEIILLQKEMKGLIRSNSRDSEMEKELKTALRELAKTQDALAQSEVALKSLEKISKAKIERLEMQVATFEQNATYLALLQEGAESRQADNERLRVTIDEMKQKLEQQEREMEAFSKNRDETIQRYEALVKQLQEDGVRNKRELKKSDSMKENEETMPDTSDDDETEYAVRSSRRKGRNNVLTVATDNIPVIELSGSESKRVTRRTALPPPATIPSTEKRKTRKKKLFAPNEDAVVDVEPTEFQHTPKPKRSPLSTARSLRKRKK
ncbi:kinesin-like protein KIF20A isoform X2 [Athalia rosae]|uniref:kinesin-like protein KIF20A isoform X2 n=1 Tax=Athalia rosae TaxID=37344 RepID=UPI0020342C66|nr:kinesin-like protein KIF20A isoform X2 [Athalia rosae]